MLQSLVSRHPEAEDAADRGAEMQVLDDWLTQPSVDVESLQVCLRQRPAMDAKLARLAVGLFAVGDVIQEAADGLPPEIVFPREEGIERDQPARNAAVRIACFWSRGGPLT